HTVHLSAYPSPPPDIPTLSLHDALPISKAGVPLQVVASALGHADARMTEKHYAHLAPSHVAQLIQDNLPQLGGTAPKKPRKVTRDRKSTRLNSSHVSISYAVFCLKKKSS